MIDKKQIDSIQEFVHAEPRTVQDIARHIDVNWKTAERYVDRIISEYGTIAKKQFRGSSQSSIKLVYWNTFSKTTDLIKENLADRIQDARTKFDFYSFEIFQYCDPKFREANIVSWENSKFINNQMTELIDKAKEEILFFSGNLSWINNDKIKNALKKAINRGVTIRIISRLDVTTLNNYNALEQISNKIEVRHREQPLRGMIVDSAFCQLKEIKLASMYKKGELASDIHISYIVRDTEWVNFLRKIFFTMYNSAPETEKRLEALKMIKT